MPVMVNAPEPVEITLPLKVPAPTFPVPLIWTPLLAPTENNDKGEVVPIPTLPLLSIVKAVVDPLLPTMA